ncbi:thiamine-monophosphate kinase [Phycicoccus elongatus]|uniref:thiamine-monophosphate kinase n=1 Tax=Phycicoccus elongatus TaxID=101689 RepID=UPI0037837256
MNGESRLDEVGEDWIIENVFAPRYRAQGTGRFGDDVAVAIANLSSERGAFVATVDPCPPPAAFELGATDPYLWGWLAATINLSDLAASGARPVGLLNSLQLPPEMRLRDLHRLLDGLDSAAAEANTQVIGGNIKESKNVDVTVTGLGVAYPRTLSREGGMPGHSLIAVGPLGAFWAEFLDIRRTGDLAGLSAVAYPRAQVAAGQLLVRCPAVKACTDNSDGLGVAALHIARAAGCGVVLEPDECEYSPNVRRIADAIGVSPLRLAIGWGDWNLVCAVPSADEAGVKAELARQGIASSRIGHLINEPGLHVQEGGVTRSVAPLASERLTKSSWMTSGLSGYIEQLLSWGN